ncbi:MAG TPA: hypothetical protein P5528_10790 [Steroidobacteraceae bacterium]|nr:hypothetical protein [Steroidobacteraceae bacterium]
MLAEFGQNDVGRSSSLEIGPLRQSHLILAAFALPLAWSAQAAPPASSEALDFALPDRVGGLVLNVSSYEDVIAQFGPPDNAQFNADPAIPHEIKVMNYARYGLVLTVRQDLYKKLSEIKLERKFAGVAADGLRMGMPIAEAEKLLIRQFGPPSSLSSSSKWLLWFLSNHKGRYALEVRSYWDSEVHEIIMQGSPNLSKKADRENERYMAGINAQAQADIAAAAWRREAAYAAAPHTRPRLNPRNLDLRPLPLASSAPGQLAVAVAYRPGVTTWDTFVRDGWAKHSPHNGELGILRLTGRLGETLDIELGVVMEKPGHIVNPPEISLISAFEMLPFGVGYNFEAGYFDSEPIQLPSGKRLGGISKAELVCRLKFVKQVLTENDCTKE